MGQIKGQTKYNKWQSNDFISYREALLAQCYICNGEEESNMDCLGFNCPLYCFSPYANRRLVRFKGQKRALAGKEHKFTLNPNKRNGEAENA